MGIIVDRAASGSRQHLMSELARIDLKLRAHVKQASTKDNYWGSDNLRGLYISEAEISGLLASSPLEQLQDDFNDGPNYQFYDSVLSQVDSGIRTVENDCPLNKGSPRMEKLVKLFSLSPFEIDALLLSLLPEIDLKYERIFGYVQDDVTRKRPSIALALDILCGSHGEKLSRRILLSPESSLVKNNLLIIVDDYGRRGSSQLGRSLMVDDRIRDYLFEFDDLDTRLSQFTKIIKPHKGLEGLVLPHELKDRLLRLTHKTAGDPSIIFYFHGAGGTGKQTIAGAISYGSGHGLMAADAVPMVNSSSDFDRLVRLLCREAQLQEMPVYWDNFDILFDDKLTSQLRIAAAELAKCPCPIFLAGNKEWATDHTWQNKRLIEIEIPPPGYNQRKQLWHTYLDGSTSTLGAVVDALATKFRLNTGQIHESFMLAQNIAIHNDTAGVSEKDLHQACRLVSNQKLKELARKIEPGYEWSDIILPVDQLEQLSEICNQVKYSQVVFGDWGFGCKRSLGKGLNALFAGPSGTGKTMAAEIIANELKLDLYKIDLSMVVSKYIGETEKNLDRIFKEAQDSNAILFFDEADSLFGKRSEVKDAHDRYANIEIAYLLQKMEEYEGIVILATNLRKNLDEAFARRIHFSIDFPFPEIDQRLLIWQKAFSTQAPMSDDIDFSFMARQFRIAGGNIKNVALSAAFLAAGSGESINMRHVILATRREYQKMGKLCTEADFAGYFKFLKD